MKIFITISLIISVICLLVFHYILTDIPQTLNLFLQIFGGFVATLFGVYISLNLSNKEEDSKEKKQRQNNLIESLILINRELSYNNHILNQCISMLSKKSIHVKLINNDFNDARFSIQRLEDRAYYSIIGSNKFKEIIDDFELLNTISDSYDNLKLTTNFFFMCGNLIAEDVKNKEFSDIKYYAKTLKMCIGQLEGQIKVNSKSIKKIEDILNEYGIGYKDFFEKI